MRFNGFAAVAATAACLALFAAQIKPAASTKLRPAAASAQDHPRRAGALPPVSNHITLSSESGTGMRPFTISRVFAQGEIPRYAQVVVNGQALPTQCNVMTRWPDSSVQHAMISFWSEVPPRTNVEVRFQDQENGLLGGGVDAAEMLSTSYDFGAVMELDNGRETRQADARTMLQTGGFRYRLKGEICTQVIIEDRSAARVHDAGFDEARSFHPIFVATFYPGWRGVKVDLIGENVWTGALQDLTYSLRLRAGSPLPAVPNFSKSGFLHYARTRWRKTFWSGLEPANVSVDLNLPYLIYSRLIPSFDLTRTLPESAVAEEVRLFQGGDRGELGGKGFWIKYFPTTGGRADLGLFARPYVRYLYSFDRRLEEVIRGYADVSGYIPIHYRESVSGRPFLAGASTDAVGHPVSLDARPTVSLPRLGDSETKSADRITALSSLSAAHGWTVDLAHQPAFVFLPYMLTGDWYWLEELYFWAAFNVTASSPCSTSTYCRHADWGYINHEMQTRGVAWAMRTLGQAAFAAPESDPEKEYFLQKLYNNIAIREGMLGITDGYFYDPEPESRWEWGSRVPFGRLRGNNPLAFMDPMDQYASVSGMAPAESPYRPSRVNSPWMYNYFHIVLGHLEELGFPVRPVRTTLAKNLLHQILDPDYNPYLTGAYRIPVVQQSTQQLFQDWKSVKLAHSQALQEISRWPQGDENDVDHGYPHIAKAAASFLMEINDGTLLGRDAWAWMEAHVGAKTRSNSNPMWALVPRDTQQGAAANKQSDGNFQARSAR